MRVLVTGGAGYIGSHASLRLLEDGHEVVSIDNVSRGHAQAESVLRQIGGIRMHRTAATCTNQNRLPKS